MTMDEFESTVLLLELKTWLGSESSLELLVDASANIDGGKALTYSDVMKRIGSRVDPSELESILIRKDPEVRRRVRMALR